MLLSEVAEKSFANFNAKNWPNCLLITGDNTIDKIKFLHHKIATTLHLFRKKSDDSLEKIVKLMQDGSHPDFFLFPAGKIKIGDPKNPEPGTIRYLLNHFLPYAPYYSHKKFVFFEDASQINHEAESALLKSLEEPPANCHFILSADTADNLKETIVSRCLELYLPTKLNMENLPNDRWQQFWYLNGLTESLAWQIAQLRNWLSYLKESYDQLAFSAKDYPIFDRLLIIDFKKNFGKDKVELQAQLLELSLKPLQYAIRDALVAGPVIELAPLRLPKAPQKQLLMLHKILTTYFQQLQERVFMQIPLNINLITANMLAKWIPLWAQAFQSH